jgi:glycine/D-amino acid oxidase-like deaminating enzyme
VDRTPLIDEQVPGHADVVVIGAGVTGICTSLFLAERGADVCVLDRSMPWSEASGVNAGTLTVQGEYIDTIPLTRLSVGLWEEFAERLGVDMGFSRIGGLRVATTDSEIADLQIAAQEGRERWNLEIEWLDDRALRIAAPWLGVAVRAATFCREDAMCSPLTAGNSLVAAAARAGATIVAKAAVEQIAFDGQCYRIETPRGSIQTASVVVAAGPWSSGLTQMLGTALPTYVDIDMLTVTEPCAPKIDRVVTHAGGVLSLKQFSNGSVVIGGGWQGKGRFAAMEKQLDQTRLLQNLSLAATIVPSLSELRILRSWSGYEGVAADGMPVVGRLPSTPGAYVAAITRGGFTHGPAMALLIAELILEGNTRFPIGQFGPERLAASPSVTPTDMRRERAL